MEPLKLSFRDDVFPRKEGAFHTRKIARGLVYQDGRLLIHLVHRNDVFAFGETSYPETPGGGLEEGESYLEAVKRECLEELGLEIEVKAYLGEVHDEYALIARRNLNRFFLCEAIGGQRPLHLVSSGDSLIEKTMALTLEEAIRLYEENEVSPIFSLVKRRELPFLYLLRDHPELLS